MPLLVASDAKRMQILYFVGSAIGSGDYVMSINSMHSATLTVIATVAQYHLTP